MSAVTKEGVTVKVGQVWMDLDIRTVGPCGGRRTCTVVRVDEATGHAIMSVDNAKPYRTTKVKIARMHKTTTGWGLVWEQGVQS